MLGKPNGRRSFRPSGGRRQSTAYKRLVEAADKLCGYLKAVQEDALGNREFVQAKTALRGDGDVVFVGGGDSEAADDAVLVGDEVERCRSPSLRPRPRRASGSARGGA